MVSYLMAHIDQGSWLTDFEHQPVVLRVHSQSYFREAIHCEFLFHRADILLYPGIHRWRGKR